MHYVVSYEICALLFLTIIAINFFSKNRFPILTNRYLGLVIIVVLIDLISDIIGTYTIAHVATVPILLNIIVNTIYYAAQFLLPSLLYLYVLACSGRLRTLKRWILLISISPMIVFEILLLMNPVTKLFFYFDDAMIYRWGIGYLATYIMGFGYIVIALISIIIVRKELDCKLIIRVLILSTIIMTTVIFQFIFKSYLLIGMGATLAILVVYLNMQNNTELKDIQTGLFNRAAFLLFLKENMEQREKCNLVFFGIDKMQLINEMFSIKDGDKVIIETVNRLKQISSTKLVFRVSGDSFALVLKNQNTCEEYMKRIIDMFNKPWVLEGVEINVSACICSIKNEDFGYDNLRAMAIIEYMIIKAKNNGPGTIVEIKSKDIEAMERQLDIETRLREAVEKENFEIVFQPIYSTVKKRIVSAEALIRYEDEKWGKISPAEFIPLVEKNGLIIKIGKLVQKKVFHAIRENNLDQIEGFQGIQINLSALELLNENLPKQIRKFEQQFKVKGEFLTFEITETVALSTGKMSIDAMERIMNEGIKFALDDFGTGYANIEMIMKMPFSTVKIDRSMMKEIVYNEKSAMILENFINIIRGLGATIIVEGVENKEESEIMKKMDVDYIQGFYYWKPMQIECLLERLNA